MGFLVHHLAIVGQDEGKPKAFLFCFTAESENNRF
jgi:hypothetical protein